MIVLSCIAYKRILFLWLDFQINSVCDIFMLLKYHYIPSNFFLNNINGLNYYKSISFLDAESQALSGEIGHIN